MQIIMLHLGGFIYIFMLIDIIYFSANHVFLLKMAHLAFQQILVNIFQLSRTFPKNFYFQILFLHKVYQNYCIMLFAIYTKICRCVKMIQEIYLMNFCRYLSNYSQTCIKGHLQIKTTL